MTQPIVTIKNGKLRGKIVKNYNGDEYYSFQGIPYGKPPIGKLRFKAPIPSDSWEGIRNATVQGHDCINYNPVLKACFGSEDCLYVNVYTHKLWDECKTRKPVMVWVHGGGFRTGSGNTNFQGPDFLMTKDVVIVTFNYRVGLFGFLNLEDPTLEITRNAGLKDQVLALRWVQENISQFCGDPNNVTIFGSSAGAAAAHYLVLSSRTKGLFHKCILQSGCALAMWAKGHSVLPYITEALGISLTNEKEVLEILLNMTSEDLMELQNKIPDSFDPSYKRSIAPIVEANSADAFLTKDPEQIILSGDCNHVPMIIGFTSREGIFTEFYSNEVKCQYVIEDFKTKIPHCILTNSKSSKLVATKIKNFYYGNQQTGEENRTQYYLLHGDALFEWPATRTIKQHKAKSTTPIYLYQFSVDAKLNQFKKMFNCEFPGAAHGDDSFYLFKTMWSKPMVPNSIEENVIKGIVELWTNFAYYGNPNAIDSPIAVNWEPVEKDKLHYLNIGENFTIGVNPNKERIKFWEKITAIDIDNQEL